MKNPFEAIKNIKVFTKKPEDSKEVADQAPVNEAPKAKKTGIYKLILRVNEQTFERSGDDSSIFEGIDIQKLTTKAVVTIEKGDKTHEFIMTPVVLKRMLVNKTAREIQFKKMSMYLN